MVELMQQFEAGLRKLTKLTKYNTIWKKKVYEKDARKPYVYLVSKFDLNIPFFRSNCSLTEKSRYQKC